MVSFASQPMPHRRPLRHPEELRRTRRPHILYFTCTETHDRVSMGRPAHATVLSNFGNIIPPAGEGEDGASIECLVELGVEHIVICGHERCAALQALLGQQAMAPELRRWLMLADRTRHLIETHYCHLDEDARRSAAAQEHVLVQVENLLGYPIVRERVQSGRLYIHAWVEDRHRRLWEYRPQDGQFCATPLEVSP